MTGGARDWRQQCLQEVNQTLQNANECIKQTIEGGAHRSGAHKCIWRAMFPSKCPKIISSSAQKPVVIVVAIIVLAIVVVAVVVVVVVVVAIIVVVFAPENAKKSISTSGGGPVVTVDVCA